jgi:hypothetical protein
LRLAFSGVATSIATTHATLDCRVDLASSISVVTVGFVSDMALHGFRLA